jgi:hypothetical protein
MLEEIGFIDVTIGPPVDTFEGAGGEKNAPRFEVLWLPIPRAKALSETTLPAGDGRTCRHLGRATPPA